MKSSATQFWSRFQFQIRNRNFTYYVKIFVKPKCVVTENRYLTSGKPKHITNCYQLYTAFCVRHPGPRPASSWKTLCRDCGGSSGAISMGRSLNGREFHPLFEWGVLKSSRALCWAGKKKFFLRPKLTFPPSQASFRVFWLVTLKLPYRQGAIWSGGSKLVSLRWE